MESQPKPPDVEGVLAGLEHNWQELVKLLKEGQGRPSPERLEPGESVPAGAGVAEAGAPSRDQELGKSQISPAPETPSAEPPAGPAPALTPEPAGEKLPPRKWGQRIFNIAVLVLLVAALGGLYFLLAQTQWGGGRVETGDLVLRGKDGAVHAWLGERDGRLSLSLLDKAGKARAQLTLDAGGSPSLTLLDDHKNRVELKMGAEGEPLLRRVQEPSQQAVPQAKAPPPAAGETAAPEAARPAPPGPEPPEHLKAGEGAAPIAPGPGPEPGARQPEEAGAGAPAAAYIGKLVGSKTSNKYHYPDCKWAKKIRPDRMIIFNSAEEAREKGYIPCPACKPPAH